MNAKQILCGAKDLIKDPANWTQDCDARNADGICVSPLSSSAVCWCAVGALRKVSLAPFVGNLEPIPAHATKELSTATAVLAIAASSVRPGNGIVNINSIVNINDELGHAKVMEMYDRAIARLEGDS